VSQQRDAEATAPALGIDIVPVDVRSSADIDDRPWMQNVGVALMTTLTPSPVLVALIQTATTLPVFLVGLPAGALADLVDRRRLLLVSQSWMLLAAAALSFLTLAESHDADHAPDADVCAGSGRGDEQSGVAGDRARSWCRVDSSRTR
jgi:MFS family permease